MSSRAYNTPSSTPDYEAMRTGTYDLLSLCPPILAIVQKIFDGWIQEGENSVFILGAGSKFSLVSIAKSVYVLFKKKKSSSIFMNAFCGRRWQCYSSSDANFKVTEQILKPGIAPGSWVSNPILSLISLSPIFVEHHYLDKE